MRLLVSLALLLSACASDRGARTPDTAPIGASCYDPVCAAVYGTMLFASVVGTPVSASERRRTSQRIAGTCEIKLPQMSGVDACGTVLLTLTGVDGSTRKAWVEGSTFEVDHLSKGPYQVVAESEQYGLSATVADVPVGSRVAIQFTAKPRPAQPK